MGLLSWLAGRRDFARPTLCRAVAAAALCALSTMAAPSIAQPDRETWQPPGRILDAIGVRPGMRVGEAGAGRGYFTFPLARRVGAAGFVYANDISQPGLDAIAARALAEGLANVRTVAGGIEDPRFPEKNLDMVVMVYVLHDLERPVAFLRNVRSYLAPGARLAIVERDTARDPAAASHFMGEQRVLETLAEGGFDVEKADASLPRDTIYVCRAKVAAAE